jgi:hypothetical protein
MSHSIDHARLRLAADHLLTIDRAGYGAQVEAEYHDRLAAAGLRTTWRDPLAEAEYHRLARTLATLTEAPLAECLAAVLDAAGALPRRETGLAVLADLAGEVRRVQAEAHHYTTRRRIA